MALQEKVASTLTAGPAHFVLGAVDLVVACVEAQALAAPALPCGRFFEAWRHRGEPANETYLNPMAATSTAGAWLPPGSVRAPRDPVGGGLANEAPLDPVLAFAVKARHLAGATSARR